MSCAECEDFEFCRDRPLRWLLTTLFTRLMVRAYPLNGLCGVLSIAIGGQPPPTHYEHHREEYARTGDPLEMERMLRQVRA